jgi:hypothetical protein
VSGSSAEAREFVLGRTRVTPAPDAKDTPFGKLILFTGRFEFEVSPNPLTPGGSYRVQVFLKNDSKENAKLQSLTITITVNGQPQNVQARILEDDVKVGQRPMVAEVPGTWVAGTSSWTMEVEVLSRKGERYRSSLTMKRP